MKETDEKLGTKRCKVSQVSLRVIPSLQAERKTEDRRNQAQEKWQIVEKAAKLERVPQRLLSGLNNGGRAAEIGRERKLGRVLVGERRPTHSFEGQKGKRNGTEWVLLQPPCSTPSLIATQDRDAKKQLMFRGKGGDHLDYGEGGSLAGRNTKTKFAG